MKAVILGAGLGTRLGSLTESTPKILLPVHGVPLLMRQARYLREQGVRELAVNAFHHAEKVGRAARDLGIRVFTEERLLGTAGALLPMQRWLGSDPFLLLYGDTLTDLDLSRLTVRLLSFDTAVLACSYAQDAAGKGIVLLDKWTRQVTGFVEKPDTPTSGVVFGGVAFLRPRVLTRLREGDDFGRDVFPRLASNGRLHAAVFDDVRFHDVGTLEGLEAA